MKDTAHYNYWNPQQLPGLTWFSKLKEMQTARFLGQRQSPPPDTNSARDKLVDQRKKAFG